MSEQGPGLKNTSLDCGFMQKHSLLLEQKLLQSYFDIIPFDIYVVDVTDYSIVFMNRQMRSQVESDDLGKPCYDVLYHEDEPCSFCRIKSLVDATGKPTDKSFIYEQYNEMTERWRQLHEKAISWPDGRTVKYTIGVDIGELKSTQNRLAEAHAELALRNKDLRRQNEILQENVRLREDIDRMTRHDLKGPLFPILGVPGALLDDFPDLPDQVRSGLTLVASSGAQMLDMINKSQDMIRLEQGNYVLNAESFELTELLGRVAGDMKTLSSARSVSIVFVVNDKNDSGNILIEGERLLYYSLFSNLIKNAVEAAPDDSEVLVSVTTGAEVVVRILNHGETPMEIRDRFFEKYATAGKEGGMGIGTYSARLIAQAHGGDISLDVSRPGMTEVCVRLPFHPVV